LFLLSLTMAIDFQTFINNAIFLLELALHRLTTF
jgi:hypothetical protein